MVCFWELPSTETIVSIAHTFLVSLATHYVNKPLVIINLTRVGKPCLNGRVSWRGNSCTKVLSIARKDNDGTKFNVVKLIAANGEDELFFLDKTGCVLFELHKDKLVAIVLYSEDLHEKQVDR